MDKLFNIKTDLALEAGENIFKGSKEKIDGVNIHEDYDSDNNINITWIDILNENGANKLGKPIGNYVTIESSEIKQNSPYVHERIIKILSKTLGDMHNLKEDGKVLIVGLGNWNITPDSLGPKVISNILVTNHIMEANSVPPDIINKVRYVSAVSPGVMGTTGIETASIIKGIVDNLKPDLIIAVDSLAARNTSRINSTIQISNTGIIPGSGMGNKRKGITKDTMGIPVIVIGVPTVIDASTMVNDTIDKIVNSMMEHCEEDRSFYSMLKNIENKEKYNLIKEILEPYNNNMFVTPTEVDKIIDRLSNIISNSINIGINMGINVEDINRYFG